MATKQKESSLRKEKKATPSSTSHSTQIQGSSKATTPASTDKEKSSSSSGKPIPNYLRPTISSKPESPKNVKKTGNVDSNQKASLLRRRSFDRPPSTSRIQKAFASPDDQKQRPSSRDRNTIRSSSFTSKAATSPRPVLDRNSKLVRQVKSQPPASPTTMTEGPSLSRSGSLSKKSEKDTYIGKVPSSEEVTQDLDLETTEQSNQEPFVPEDEKTVNVESEVQEVLSAPQLEPDKPIDDIDTQIKNDEDEKVTHLDSCTVSEEKTVSPPAQIEETADELHGESGETQQKAEQNRNKEESSNGQPEEDTADKAEVEADQDKNMNENEASTEAVLDEKELEDEDHVDEVSDQELKSKEEQRSQAAGAEEAKPEATQKQQGGQGKKESTAYNDVIEETKNKLLEKRKNKVKALVGAFETVIDYETAASK